MLIHPSPLPLRNQIAAKDQGCVQSCDSPWINIHMECAGLGQHSHLHPAEEIDWSKQNKDSIFQHCAVCSWLSGDVRPRSWASGKAVCALQLPAPPCLSHGPRSSLWGTRAVEKGKEAFLDIPIAKNPSSRQQRDLGADVLEGVTG